MDEEAERILRVKGTFEEFTYWNYDKIPSASDGYTQALQIVQLADVVGKTCFVFFCFVVFWKINVFVFFFSCLKQYQRRKFSRN